MLFNKIDVGTYHNNITEQINGIKLTKYYFDVMDLTKTD